jgi:hypothetical protein
MGTSYYSWTSVPLLPLRYYPLYFRLMDFHPSILLSSPPPILLFWDWVGPVLFSGPFFLLVIIFTLLLINGPVLPNWVSENLSYNLISTTVRTNLLTLYSSLAICRGRNGKNSWASPPLFLSPCVGTGAMESPNTGLFLSCGFTPPLHYLLDGGGEFSWLGPPLSFILANARDEGHGTSLTKDFIIHILMPLVSIFPKHNILQ